MSHFDDIRAAIVARLTAVPDIGIVHSYQRYAADIQKMRALYVADINGRQQLRGWYVTRTAFAENEPFNGRRTVTCQWQIRGYMALEDESASELAFDGLVDRIADAFREDDTLGGVVAGTAFGGDGNPGPDQAGIQAPEIQPVMFAGVLCHAARLELLTRSFLQVMP